MNRYHRQTLLPQIGAAGEQRLARSSVLLVGCGALGTVIADQLVRAGIGRLRLCDRDLVETTNLQRQVLFDENDAKSATPKAIAATARLGAINSTVAIEPHVIDVHGKNIESLCDGVDLVLDGTDNVQTRYLINDAAVKLGLPWVYGACVGVTGRAMGVVPGRSPCLRCLFPDPPGPGELPTCDTAGVLAPVAGIVASLQVVEAMRILLLDSSAATELTTIDLWPTRFRTISTIGSRRDDCPTCARRRFEFLDARPSAVSLCGRNTVQISPSNGKFDFTSAVERLSAIAPIERSPYFVRCATGPSGVSLTLFPDGRAMVHGTSDPAVARSIYARFVGS